MEFKEIKTFGHLRNFLSVKGKGHHNYRQYTNLDGVYGIINSGFFWLSRGDQMNDMQELTKGDPDEWKKIYIASFAFGRSENIAMWTIYGLLHDEAACISFPSIEFCKWISSISELFDPADGYKKINVKFEIDLIDVVYIGGIRGQRDGLLQWNSERMQLDNENLEDDFKTISSQAPLTGYMKNYAWVYENEVRIRIKLNEPIDCKKVAVKLPIDFFNTDPKNEKVGIISGPWNDYDKYSIFDKKLAQSENFQTVKDKLIFRESDFDRLVKTKETCEYCLYGNGKRVPKRKGPSLFSE